MNPITFAPTAAPAQATTPYPALAQSGPPAWAPQPAAGIPATGISLPVEIQLGYGATVRAYLHFGAEYANPEAMAALASQLANMGLLKPFTPRPQGFGGAGRGSFGRFGGGSRW